MKMLNLGSFRQFKKSLAKLPAQFALAPDWKIETRNKVLSCIRRSESWQKAPINPAKPSFWAGFRYWIWEGRILKPALVIFLVFVVVSGSSFWTVTAAQASLPGDILYPVKITIEKAQINLVLNEEKRAELEMNFAGKRLEEINKILNEDKEDESVSPKTEVKISKALEHFTQTLAQAEKRMEKENVSVSKVVNEKTIILEENLLDIKEKIISQESASGAKATSEGLAVEQIAAPNSRTKENVVKNEEAGSKSLVSVEKALDKVDETNTKSLTAIVNEAAGSGSSELKQAAVDKLQEKIKKVEENIVKISTQTDAIISTAAGDQEKADLLKVVDQGNETTTLPTLDKKNQATSSLPAVSKEAIEEAGKTPAEAKKTIEEAKHLLSENTDSLNQVLGKIRESKAIVKEVKESIKAVETINVISNDSTNLSATSTSENAK